MNTNPNAKVVLCFGDSNTYGTIPDSIKRYPSNVRWTGKLQELLGDNYYIIEEGLGGRATDLDHPNPKKSSRNGLDYFKPCFDSHLPIDIVIIMLGTNDLKTRYNRTPQDVADAIDKYIVAINEIAESREIEQPKILLVSPPHMDERIVEHIGESQEAYYDMTSVEKSKEMAEPIKAVANKNNCLFLDVASVAKPGEDGAHLTQKSHQAMAEAIAKIIK